MVGAGGCRGFSPLRENCNNPSSKKSHTLVLQMKHEDGHFFLLPFQTPAGLLSSVRLSPPGLVLRVQLHHLSIAPASVIRSQQGRRTL